MVSVENKNVLVLGLGASGLAATALLRRRGATVVALDSADTEILRRQAEELRKLGAEVRLGASTPPAGRFDLVVVSPGVPWSNPGLKAMVERGVPVIGEFELGYQHSLCLNVAITGTNGKTTTTEMIERLLTRHNVKTIAAGNIGLPLCR